MQSDGEEGSAPQAAAHPQAAQAPRNAFNSTVFATVPAPPPPAHNVAITSTPSSSSSSSSAAAAAAAASAAAEAQASASLAELSDLKAEYSKSKLLLSRERLRATAAEKSRGEAEQVPSASFSTKPVQRFNSCQELGLLRAELVKLKSNSAAVPSRDSAEVAKANKAKEQYRKEAESLRRQVESCPHPSSPLHASLL
jgi:hypothetical protein